MPGVLTASEVDLGLRLGADPLKLFPAEPLGPAYLASLMQPFPEARLIPTGGVSAANAGAYLKAGAAALAMGSSLFPARRLATASAIGTAQPRVAGIASRRRTTTADQGATPLTQKADRRSTPSAVKEVQGGAMKHLGRGSHKLPSRMHG